jgi:AmmeMemoRadiSam system protein B
MQIPMLQFTLQKTGREARILPIILSNVPKLFDLNAAMEFRKTMAKVGEAVRNTIRNQEKRACIIASGDFTHCGPYYGDPKPDAAAMDEVSRFDSKSIELIMSGKKDDFFKRTAITKYCCVTPVYLLLSCLESSLKARLLKYYTSWDIAGQKDDVNTFASILFC